MESHCHGEARILNRRRVCCLLVLNSVTPKPQWICQPKPRDVAHDACVCLCVNACSEILGLFSPWISGYAFSSTLAFSLRLVPSRLAVGAISSFQAPPLLRPRSSPPPNGFILLTCPLHLGLRYVHLTWRLNSCLFLKEQIMSQIKDIIIITTNLTNLTKENNKQTKNPNFHAPP